MNRSESSLKNAMTGVLANTSLAITASTVLIIASTLVLTIGALVITTSTAQVWAAVGKAKSAVKKPVISPDSDVMSKKNLDFDDHSVEALNRKPLDSLSQISERDRKRQSAHLYRKRENFVPETGTTLQQLRYQE